MAETSRFWDGLISEGAAGDAGTYSAANFADLIASIMSDRTGVLSGLAVVESSPAAKSVTVETGRALISGRLYVNDADKALTIADNASGNPRIDYIVMECDWTAQTIRLDVVQGTPAGSPIAPSLTQVAGTLWQEPLAQVAVSNGFTTITESDITREREWARADYPGKIEPSAIAVAPSGWLPCYGQAVSRTTYRNLFDAIGTAYGSGDGSTTFNVPDMRGRVWAGRDNIGSSANRVTDAQADSMGGTMGAETHTLTIAEMPTHDHTFTKSIGTSSSGNYIGSSDTSSSTFHTNAAGSGDPHNNMQPTMFGNWIIKT